MQKKYLTIYDDLVDKIKAGIWPVNTLLPSENDLTNRYETSRETIRKALNLLSQNGYIQKVRGKGSIVLDAHKFSFPVSGIVSYKELTKQLNITSNTIVQELSYMETPSALQELVNIEGNVWRAVRIREIDGEKIILDKDYFSEMHVPFPTKEICEDSIYQYIEEELGLTIGFAQKEIVVEEPTKEDYELLSLEGFSNIVVIKSHVYLDDTSLFQYTESRHRPDKFRFIDFARRI
ncbi:GntR family transcriptional regulator, trehalose operon transcriptional repressor [Oceanobacillus limi]|uniref:Trehalose operon repressor n=1 Tax=Oceanobacillus limi TaxID=930131 RepID=A0A1I0AS33_9BACI|nr:trehalose operon repressor [Oceanobacillus limi]SES97203.1 GntR family transcriptional regulator, trehalose operon transcriptional repressor [Oceanobacillus limi]